MYKFSSFMIRYYLWGIEISLPCLTPSSWHMIRYYLWGIEISVISFFFSPDITRLDTTYEELKYLPSSSLLCLIKWLDTTYEELKLDGIKSMTKKVKRLDTTYEELKYAMKLTTPLFELEIRYYLWGIEIYLGTTSFHRCG